MLPTTSTSSWLSNFSDPSQLFGIGVDDYELYEADDEFVLTIDMPGFSRDEIHVNWDEGRLFISAEHSDPDRGREKTYSRTFRMPKEIEPDEINAQYRNGVLEIRLPIVGPQLRGTEIPVTD